MAKLEFRETAINQYAATEQIDGMMQVMRPSAWFWLAACGLITLAALLWSFNGTIVTKVEGKGIIVYQNGGLMHVLAPAAGRLKHIFVQPGERIKAMQVVAEIDQPFLLQKVKACENELAFLKLQLDKSKEQGASKNTIADHELSVVRAQDSLQEAKSEYDFASKAICGQPGVISSFFLGYTGKLVEQYQPLFALQTGEDKLQALVFFPTGTGKEIQPGQIVEINPASSNKEETGCLLGKVVSVSRLPVSQFGMRRLIDDETLVQNWCSTLGAPIAARVDLIRDPNSPNLYKWTSPRGSSVILSSGTLIDASAHVKVTRVITLLIPAIKQFLGETTP
ncbi:MAG: hypothetical protein K2W82_04190 [Candidatus Obscuribacterales bacterium]|nr:hypothetical protein [Candidatus Obscuribacterales bacterium]